MTFNASRKVAGERGYILLPVAIAIALIATIAFMSSRESGMGINMSASELEGTRATYVAQAGLQHALRQTAQQGCGPYTDLTNVALGDDQYTTSLTTDLGETSSSTPAPDQDAWIGSVAPSTNNGGDSSLHISELVGSSEIALLRYDLSSVPAGASILSAQAWFYVQTGHPEGPIEIHGLSADWTEADATWDTLATAIEPGILATIPPQSAAGVWLAVNLTPQVQAWVNGQPNQGLALVAGGEGIDAVYLARDSANPPYLEVVLGTPATGSASLKAVGTTAQATSRTITRALPALRQAPPGFLSLRPDATEGLDTYVYEWKSTWNYGASDEIWVSNYFTDSEAISLLKFNLGRLPHGVRVQNATLRLYQHSPSVNGGEVGVHRIKRAWDEGEKSGGAGPGATWIVATNTANWADPGGDFDTAPVATQTVPTGSVGYYEWDISALVQGWASGQFENQGLALAPAAPATEAYFRSSDYTVPEQRPVLEVSYTCACDQACLAPQGSGGRIVMIGNWPGLFPDPRDLEKETIIESWGYQVDQADDNYIWAINFNDYDAVYVSETVRASDVIGQLSWRSIGIVSEEGGLYFDLGFADADTETVGQDLDVVDNSHYITAPFATGALNVYDAAMEFIYPTGNKASGMQNLATAKGFESLMVLDAGATTVNGPAPGRRVALPLGRATNADFNWTYLNNNGRLLVQRAIDWAMGADITGAGSILLVSGGSAFFNIVTGRMMVLPTAQEQLRIDLMKSWGYTVNLIHGTDSASNFLNALSANDVVYVSGDASETAVDSKLSKSAIGIVNEQIALHDQLWLSTSAVSNSFNNIQVINNTHYLTEGLSTGWHTITNSNQPLNALMGTLAPGMTNLAEVWVSGANYDFGLAVVDTGGQLVGGETASGRRVQIPWGTSGFDFNQLNDNGKNLMRRAIEWAAAKPDLRPLAHWKLDETSGTTATDSEGGHDGTLTNGPAWSKGMFDGGLHFDGSDDVVRVPDADELDITDEITLAAWIRPSAVGTQYVLRKAQYGSTDGYELSLSTTGEVFFRLNQQSSGDSYRIDSSSDYPSTGNEWMHIAGTYDGATLRLYINGVQEAQLNASITIGTNSTQLTLGGQEDGTRVINGRIDEARLYNRALDPTEIAELAELPGPIAHWKLDESSGTTAIDSVGGHDGTLAGATWTLGHDNGALQFDGLNDYVDLTSDAELDDAFVGGATVMAWINPAGWGGNGYGRVFDKSSSAASTGDGWAIRLNADNDGLNFGQGFTGGRGWWRAAVGEISHNTWQHIAVVYDAGSVSNDPLIYLNGVPLAVTEVDAPSGDLRSDAAINLRLGNFAGDTTNAFDGVIDDARIYGHMLDESEIAAIAASGGGGGGPVTGSCNGTYRDEFNAVSWDGTDGTLDWSANPWVESGESDGVSKGDVRVKNDLSDFQLQIADNDNGGEGVERVVDLTGAGTAILSFDYRRKDLDDSGDYVAVYASSNGTSGPWAELPAPRIEGGGTDGSYQPYSRDISAFISANTAIRLRSSPDNGGRDFVFFDNIQIQCTP